MSTLYIVATPIGNLEDITMRALRILRTVSIIACEDTRETLKLLQAYDIPAPLLLSYHAQSTNAREEKILQLLKEGQSVALVSDRGTPGVSDPGARIIQSALAEGVEVIPIPGPSALVTALQASGADTSHFYFGGFIPHKKGRATFIQHILTREETVVFYESPHRILKCLQQCIDAGVADRPMVVGRELTKQYEEFLRGTTAEILQQLTERPQIQGEFVVILDSL